MPDIDDFEATKRIALTQLGQGQPPQAVRSLVMWLAQNAAQPIEAVARARAVFSRDERPEPDFIRRWIIALTITGDYAV